MVTEFEEASFNGKIGEVQKPVKTRYGSHIIKTTGKSNVQYVVERIINKIEPSGTTYDRLYNNAGDFSYLAEKNGFDSEAELMKYDIVESAEIKEENNVVPGLGTSKPLVKFVFENSIGTVSQVFKVPSGYVVGMISEIKPGGYKPIEEVTDDINKKVLEQKKLDRTFEIAKEIKEKIGDGDDFGDAQSVFSRVKINNVNNFKASSPIPGIGKDNYFNAYCFSGELKKLSNPIRGERGSYLVKINSRTKFDSTSFAIQKVNTRNMLLQQKQSAYFTSWLNNIKDQIEIEDLRYRFYR
jgi:parvulin-like peptidyl-prolyl isomerase